MSGKSDDPVRPQASSAQDDNIRSRPVAALVRNRRHRPAPARQVHPRNRFQRHPDQSMKHFYGSTSPPLYVTVGCGGVTRPAGVDKPETAASVFRFWAFSA